MSQETPSVGSKRTKSAITVDDDDDVRDAASPSPKRKKTRSEKDKEAASPQRTYKCSLCKEDIFSSSKKTFMTMENYVHQEHAAGLVCKTCIERSKERRVEVVNPPCNECGNEVKRGKEMYCGACLHARVRSVTCTCIACGVTDDAGGDGMWACDVCYSTRTSS